MRQLGQLRVNLSCSCVCHPGNLGSSPEGFTSLGHLRYCGRMPQKCIKCENKFPSVSNVCPRCKAVVPGREEIAAQQAEFSSELHLETEEGRISFMEQAEELPLFTLQSHPTRAVEKVVGFVNALVVETFDAGAWNDGSSAQKTALRSAFKDLRALAKAKGANAVLGLAVAIDSSSPIGGKGGKTVLATGTAVQLSN